MKPQSDIQIFITDDDPDDLLMIQEAFEATGNGAHLTCFDQGDVLLDTLQRANDLWALPQLIVLDLNMPGSNGRDIIVEIKANKKLCHIPIIVLTTSFCDQEITECYKLGASSYIVKPASYNGLLKIVRLLKSYWIEVTELPRLNKYYD